MELTVLPSAPVIEAAFSDPQVVAVGFSSVPVSVLPDGFIPVVPLYATAAASGSGTSTVRVALMSRMAGTGAGTPQVSPRGSVSAAVTGSGKLTAPAYVVGQVFPTSIEADGTGDKLATSGAGTRVTPTGTGTLTASPGTRIAAAGQSAATVRPVANVRATSTGTGTSTAAHAVRTTATATGTGTTTVSASTYLPQKMVKSGAYTLPQNLTYRDVLGWAPDNTYPGTVIVSDGLAVKAGRPITVSATLLRTGSNEGNRARIIDTAGNEIASATAASPITVGPVTYTPTVDTILRIQAYANAGFGGNPTIPDDPASHLTVIPV